MIVTVPTPELDCVAARALKMEGLAVQEELCLATTDYGELFSDLWDAGEPFLICEWDVIPWPGAMERLWSCPEPWCTHAFPLHQGNITRSFGLGKYVPDRDGPPAPLSWAESPWYLLDGYVVPLLNELFGGPHVHEPPVAHARRELAA